jgi:hypothetical protein
MGGVTDVGEEWQYCRTQTRVTGLRQGAGVPRAVGHASAQRPAQMARI